MDKNRLRKIILDASSIIKKDNDSRYKKSIDFLSETHEIIRQDNAGTYSNLEKVLARGRQLLKEEINTDMNSLILLISKFNQMIKSKVNAFSDKEKTIFEMLHNSTIRYFEYFGFVETHYRDFLVWLLSPISSHRLGNLFARMYVNSIAATYGDLLNNHNSLKGEDFEDLKVTREKHDIDFIISARGFYCAVEMKLRSQEHGKQLILYDEALERDVKFSSKTRKFKIYMDPKSNPVNPSQLSSKEFKVMDWWHLVEILYELLTSIESVAIQNIVKQFIIQVMSDPIIYFHNRKKIEENYWVYKYTRKVEVDNV